MFNFLGWGFVTILSKVSLSILEDHSVGYGFSNQTSLCLIIQFIVKIALTMNFMIINNEYINKDYIINHIIPNF